MSMSDNPFNEKLMTHDYPECGPGELRVEELYQAFRKRLFKEIREQLRNPQCTLKGEPRD